MPDLSTVGKRLKYARSQKRLFQKDVAAYLGVTHVDVSRWETDKHMPGGNRLIELANLFGVPATWLVRGVGPVPVITNDVPRGTTESAPRAVQEPRAGPYSNGATSDQGSPGSARAERSQAERMWLARFEVRLFEEYGLPASEVDAALRLVQSPEARGFMAGAQDLQGSELAAFEFMGAAVEFELLRRRTAGLPPLDEGTDLPAGRDPRDVIAERDEKNRRAGGS